MNTRHFLSLLLLAALWGASFLFTRIASPEFGPIPLVELRVAVASVFLLGIMAFKQKSAIWGNLQTRPFAMAISGIFNSAVPFCLISFALLSLPSSIGSILNATTPMFGAIIAFLWLGERLTRSRVLGLGIGFLGVFVLASGKLSLHPDSRVLLAMAASLLACVCYGYATNYTRKHLQGVDSLITATNSQIIAALFLLPAAVYYWPDTLPSPSAWFNVLFLGILSTGLAYIIFFRLIQEIGAARTVTVTFLIPIFGTSWGMLFLGESMTRMMLVGAAIIVLGTVLSSGLIKLGWLEKTTDKTGNGISTS